MVALEREIGKWGNAAAIRLPTALLAQIGLEISSRVSIEVHKGSLVITPLEVREPQLDYLLGDTPQDHFRVDGDADWLDSDPAGTEIL